VDAVPPTALLVEPYLRTLGGGERVMVSVAEVLAPHYRVTMLAPTLPDPARWKAFGLPDWLRVERANARWAMRRTRHAEVSVTLANHVPLPSFARRAVLIVQFPYDDIHEMSARRRVWSRWVLRRYTLVAYSRFVADHIADRWAMQDVAVVAPPVRLRRFDPSAKAPLILSVGRLSPVKRHDVLIDAYEALRSRHPSWEMVIAGGADASAPKVQEMVEAAKAVGVTVLPDVTEAELNDLYRRASIYWHAAGYGRPVTEPELAEHFGMATVEAMSAGAVPLAFDDGGQAELMGTGCGIGWRTVDELVDATAALIAEGDRRQAMARAAAQEAARFSEARFRARIEEILDLG
jgi:glycosyltransferase involved in cell wall biosynthesis